MPVLYHVDVCLLATADALVQPMLGQSSPQSRNRPNDSSAAWTSRQQLVAGCFKQLKAYLLLGAGGQNCTGQQALPLCAPISVAV